MEILLSFNNLASNVFSLLMSMFDFLSKLCSFVCQIFTDGNNRMVRSLLCIENVLK